MPKYQVEIVPNFLTYEINAETEQQAVEGAYELANKLSVSDLLNKSEIFVDEVWE
jgi:hypothetical protein